MLINYELANGLGEGRWQEHVGNQSHNKKEKTEKNETGTNEREMRPQPWGARFP